jgi:thiol-disulfide isomerase/thioredoxin
MKKDTKTLKLSDLRPGKRRLIQLYSALLFNANLKGYISGNIFKGVTKNLCTPGLNCYSCPGATTACPLGALQNAFASSGKRTPYYMLGIILLYSIMLGRWICGWLCPFGLVQDLTYKIKTPKLKKNRVTKYLSYIKYVILVFFVVIIPLLYVLKDFPLPAFCKYICPAGTFGGAIGLLINPNNSDKFGMLGPLFTWKFALMVSILVGCIFIYRMFCRFLCPLGAIYGLFNKIALFGIKLDKKSCVDCGKCISVCKMDITTVGDHECINCGDCISVCPTKAISWRGGKIILPENEIENATDDASREAAVAKLKKKKKIISIIVASVMAVVLAGALVYYNFIDKEPIANAGYEIGDACYAEDLELIRGDGYINIEDLRGKVVVVNFWGTWCGPCKEELPHFDEVAEEYKNSVVFIAVHTDMDRETALDYINEHYPDSEMKFAFDNKDEGYFLNLGGTDYYPRTLVLDADGVITMTYDGKLSKEQLVSKIREAMKN